MQKIIRIVKAAENPELSCCKVTESCLKDWKNIQMVELGINVVQLMNMETYVRIMFIA